MDIHSRSAFGGVAFGQFRGAKPHGSLIRTPLVFGLTHVPAKKAGRAVGAAFRGAKRTDAVYGLI
jgi:hypothetical protein